MNQNDLPHWVDGLADEEVKNYHRAICEEMIESGDKPVLGRKMLELVDESESPGLLRELLKIAAGDWRPDGWIQ